MEVCFPNSSVNSTNSNPLKDSFSIEKMPPHTKGNNSLKIHESVTIPIAMPTSVFGKGIILLQPETTKDIFGTVSVINDHTKQAVFQESSKGLLAEVVDNFFLQWTSTSSPKNTKRDSIISQFCDGLTKKVWGVQQRFQQNPTKLMMRPAGLSVFLVSERIVLSKVKREPRLPYFFLV